MVETVSRRSQIANLAATWVGRRKSLYEEMLRDELDGGTDGSGRHLWVMPDDSTVASFFRAAHAWADLAGEVGL